MPQRTNEYQRLVKLIHQALAGRTAKISESVMVRASGVGDVREIDVLVESEIPPYRRRIEVRRIGRKLQELVQDGTGIALRLLDSATRSGRKVTGGNLAFYTVKMLRSGRRSTGERRNDPLHPKAQLNGTCSVQSLDEPVAGSDESDEPLTLGETLAARTEDPATATTRSWDWERLVAALDGPVAAILCCLVAGADLTTLVPKLKRCRSSLQGDKRRLAQLVREHLGQDILLQVQTHARWMDNVAANREKLACRYERQAA